MALFDSNPPSARATTPCPATFTACTMSDELACTRMLSTAPTRPPPSVRMAQLLSLDAALAAARVPTFAADEITSIRRTVPRREHSREDAVDAMADELFASLTRDRSRRTA